jgi:hypothetical protein
MFALYFGNFGIIGATRRGLLFVGLTVFGAAGCNQLLLQSTPSVSDAGDASTVALVTRDSHTPYFPINDGTHHSAQVCGDCHQSDSTFTDYTCVSCHAHSADVAVGRHTFITGFVFQSSSCFSCHPTGNEAPINVDEHSNKYFTINDDAHGSLQCSDCHQDPTTSKPFTCISCHDHSEEGESMNHQGVSGYSYDSQSCLSCHTVTTAPADASTN